MELAPSVPDISTARLTLARYDQEIDNLIMLANSHEIIDAPSQGQAVMIAGNTRKIRKAIDEVRNRYIQPALDYQRQVNALANNYKDRLLAAEKGLTQKLSIYQMRVEMERRKAEAAAQEAALKLQDQINVEAKKAGVEPVTVQPPVLPVQPTKIRTEAGTAHEHQEWKHEILDESLIPREYLMVNEKAIKDAVKAGIREIAGVRIFEHTEMRLRT